jgi:ribonuclease D
MKNPTIHFHKHDLPASVTFSGDIAIDSETLGLNPIRDPLCVVQLSDGEGEIHVVQLDRNSYDAPNLKKVLADPAKTKIFHFARFDIRIIKHYLEIECAPIYCTRTASKLVRTYTDRHGLRECCREMLGVEISKQQQSSDWGAESLSEAQIEYAATDVMHLHALRDKFDAMLARENRTELAKSCFDFLITRAELDAQGWCGIDIFEH